jgi:hypothetical protein
MLHAPAAHTQKLLFELRMWRTLCALAARASSQPPPGMTRQMWESLQTAAREKELKWKQIVARIGTIEAKDFGSADVSPAQFEALVGVKQREDALRALFVSGQPREAAKLPAKANAILMELHGATDPFAAHKHKTSELSVPGVTIICDVRSWRDEFGSRQSVVNRVTIVICCLLSPTKVLACL